MNIDISIVMEWDNPHLGEAPGSESLALRRVAEELTLLGRPAELIVVCEEAEARVVGELVARHFGSFEARVLPVRDAGYYEMKNAGAAVARGKWVVLTDSDVELEPGSLARMIDVFEARNADVVCGATYVDDSTLIGRLWTFLFVFGPRNDSDAVREVNRFFANNVGFRRDIALRYPFPTDARLRGQCVTLGQQLRREGIVIWEAGGTRTKHPAPANFAQLMRRAVWQSYDLVATHQLRVPRAGALARSVASTAKLTLQRLAKIARYGPAVARAWWEVPFFAASAIGYGALSLVLLLLPAMTKSIPARLR